MSTRLESVSAMLLNRLYNVMVSSNCWQHRSPSVNCMNQCRIPPWGIRHLIPSRRSILFISFSVWGDMGGMQLFCCIYWDRLVYLLNPRLVTGVSHVLGFVTYGYTNCMCGNRVHSTNIFAYKNYLAMYMVFTGTGLQK